MKLNINEKEFTIKSRHAIEILDLAEKSGLMDKAKSLFDAGMNENNFSNMLAVIPLSYRTAHKMLVIITGDVDLVDDLDADRLPLYAMSIIKTLLFPIQYVITGDKSMEEEKKTDSDVKEDTNPGTKE